MKIKSSSIKQRESAISLDEVKEHLEHIWKGHGTRSTNMFTGKGGAILFLEKLYERELTNIEKDSLGDGCYEISDFGIHYLGNTWF